MSRIFFFLSGTVLSISTTYILLLQIRSTTYIISKSLEYQSLQLKNQSDTKRLLWIPTIPSMSWMGLIKEKWNNSLRFTSLWIQSINIIENTNSFWNRIQETLKFIKDKK
ncbi:hypothetical protein PMAC_001232 [Pneumocystis sp. 'macacae']|nr:hypothetical protein PMAC_001232 [Pneumocystis sp. 'macacae']